MRLLIIELGKDDLRDQIMLCCFFNKRLANLLDNVVFQFYLVDNEKRQLAKCVVIKLKDKFRFYPYNLYVEERHRKNGYGREIITKIELFLRSKFDDVEIEMECFINNTIACKMYENLNYKRTEKIGIVSDKPTIILEKRL